MARSTIIIPSNRVTQGRQRIAGPAPEQEIIMAKKKAKKMPKKPPMKGY